MLELRPGCEICDRDLPPASTEAVICSASTTRALRALDAAKHGAPLARYRDVPAEQR